MIAARLIAGLDELAIWTVLVFVVGVAVGAWIGGKRK